MQEHTYFSHEPLPDSSSCIRLLEILQGHDQIVCDLTTWTISDAPQYHALSYTWGNPTLTTSITVNGRALQVRRNCAYVLQQAFVSKASKYYWIDAISIDQSSTQEKNHQVAMMGNLYTRAAYVLACVGPHADDSDFLFEMIDRYRPLLASINSHVKTSVSSSSGIWSVANPIPSSRWLSLKCFFIMDATTRKRLADAYVAFMKRPYFSRVWVLQELYLATDVSCYCGPDSRPFPDLLAVSHLIDFWINEKQHMLSWGLVTRCLVSFLSDQKWLLRRQNSCKALDVPWAAITAQRGCQALASGAWGPRRLAEVLDAMRHFQCADVRDKLYGVLSLVDWHGSPVPIPDYSKDSFEIAVEILNRYLGNRACAPVEEDVLVWAHQLCRVFALSTQQNALQEALSSRYANGGIPSVVNNSRPPTQLGLGGTGDLYFELSRLTPAVMDWRPPPKNDSLWYGMRLRSRNILDQFPSQSQSRSLSYAACADHQRLGEIVDQQGHTFAYAPRKAQVGDWLLKATKEPGSMQPPITMIVRAGESNDYAIVGQAHICKEYIGSVDPFVGFEHFQPYWQAEDLLLLYWSYSTRTSSTISLDTIADWLELGICGSEGSSYVKGALAPRQLRQRQFKITGLSTISSASDMRNVC